jgi:adenylate cyclase
MLRRLARPYVWATVLVATLLAAAFPHAASSPSWLEGLLFDLARAARAHVAGAPSTPPTVLVVAVDRESLDAPELIDYPRTLFGPVWARVIDALVDAGASVIAFDLILAYTGNRFQPGYDRPLLQALGRHGGQLVLGRSATTLPAANYLAALGYDSGALGLVEAAPDADGIHRRLQAWFEPPDGPPENGLVGAVADRAGLPVPERMVIAAGPYHPERLPRLPLIEVLRCADDDPGALARAVAGRIVLIGSTMPEEDRKRTSGRFIPAQGERDTGLPCLPRTGRPGETDDTIPGVYLHAAALQAIHEGSTVRPAPQWVVAVLTGVAAALGALAGLFLPPVAAGVTAVLVGAGLFAGQAAAIDLGVWLLIGHALIALILAGVAAYLVRFTVEERGRRRIQRAFGRYLAPALVDRLAEGGGDVALGGKHSEVTIMFADLSGFTALSGQIGPQALVERTNAYLKLIADRVDASGGYVDKFIGDAVMAIWGAPAEDPDHAAHAVQAALEMAAEIAAKRAAAEARGEPAFDVKIGINSGAAVVGNVGSERRYNYTAVGEAVNIASRLEPLPGVYRCRVVVGPATESLLRGRFLFREIDAVSVKGKAEPLRIFEPLGAPGDAQAQALAAAYEAALADYRAGRFDAASAAWGRLAAAGDGPASVMAARAAAYSRTPPPGDWGGVFAVAKG